MNDKDRYEQYLQSISPEPTQSRLSSALGFLADAGKVGIIAGGIYGLKKGRVLERAFSMAAPTIAKARPTFETIEATLQSSEEALKNKGLASIFKDSTIDEITAGFTSRMQQVEIYRGRGLGSGELAFTRWMQDRKIDSRNATKAILDMQRREHIMAGINTSMPIQTGQAILDEVVPALQKVEYSSFFAKVQQEELFKLVEKTKLNEEQKKIAYDVISANINKYQPYFNMGRGKIQLPPDSNVRMSDITQAIKNSEQFLTDTLIRKASSEKSLVGRLMGPNVKPMTVNQALENNYFHVDTSLTRQFKDNKHIDVTQTALDWNEKVKNLVSRNKSVGELPVDPRVFINSKGKITDLRFTNRAFEGTLDFLANNFQIPLVNINPIRMLHWYTAKGIRNAPMTQVLRQGERQTYIFGTDYLDKSYLYGHGQIYDITLGKVVKDNMYLMSSRYGMGPRLTASLAGYEREEVLLARQRDAGIKGFIKRITDVGYQDSESDLARILSLFTKKKNPKYAPTAYQYIVNSHRSGIIDVDKSILAYNSIYSLLNQKSATLSPVAMQRLAGINLPDGRTIAELYGLQASDFAVRSKQEITSLFGKIMSLEGRQRLSSKSPIYDVMNKYIGEFRDIRHLEDTYHTIPADPSLVPGAKALLEGDANAKLVDRYQDITKAIQMDMLYQGNLFFRSRGGSLLDQVGSFTKEEQRALQDMSLLNKIRGDGNRVFQNINRGVNNDIKRAGVSEFYANFFADSVNGEQDLIKLGETVKRYSPIFGAGPGQEPARHFSSRYIAINKAHNPLRNINELIKSGAGFKDILRGLAEDTIGQIGFGPASMRAGRGNMENATTATLINQFAFTRLNDALAHAAGLGLSNKSLGSPQSAFLNLIGRRYYLPMIGLGYLGYADYLTESLTGTSPKNAALDTYAGTTLGMASVKDALGINAIARSFSKIMPGLDQVSEWLPVKALNLATFGLIGDSRSRTELEQYYKEGYDPIYRGRYWGIGSSTPWAGDRIQMYLPAAYRRMRSDYMMTDVMYGSKSEYYANSPLVTLNNPLGPIKSLILDPHHWYNKHKEDRPYPTSGGSSYIEDIPLVGPGASYVLDFVGLVNDKERGDLSKAHRAYLREINEEIKSKKEAAPEYLRITPGGSMKFVDTMPLSPRGIGLSGMAVSIGDRFSGIMGSATGMDSYPIISVQDYSRGQLKNINQSIIQRGVAKSQLRDFRYRNEAVEREYGDDFFNIDTIHYPDSLSHRFRESLYSMSEIAGFYGFSASLPFGSNEPDWSHRLASATYMDTFGRNFWDRNLGGLGGMVNEIFRRFVPRNTFRREAYNPYRNKMPDWMPGLNYFMDFQHGDPYAKIPYGELRLPGGGYEATHKLHSDMLGRYGVLDRFMILGDVAPYSQEYRMYKSMIPNLNLTPSEKAEVKASLKRTSNAKKRYRLYPYRFKDIDITKQEVTVTTILDETTFLTKEFPDNPIRLAGITLTKGEHPEEAKAAITEINKLINYGSKITIGIDADPSMRIKNDTMGTIHAAVYYTEGEDKGKTLQLKLLRQGNKAITEKENDFSAASIHSRFYSSEISIGSIWESIAHLDNPLNNKFLQVRSPLEMYERKEVYGKAFQSWTSPISGILQPTLESFAHKTPLISMVQTGILGALVGSTAKMRKMGFAVGAVAGGLISSARVANEVVTGKQWIPARRRKERELNEYFDMLEYVKYKGLYERARKMAIAQEGVDVAEIIKARDTQKRSNKRDKYTLAGFKKWLKFSQDEASKRLIKETNQEINAITQGQGLLKVGPVGMQALNYYMKSKSTLYGLEVGDDVTTMYSALPIKEREFFNYFMTAKGKERQRILNIVPDNERRFLQAKWGLKVEEKPDLEEYFSSHPLPSPNWAGWSANVSLDDVKIKVIKNEGLDLTEFGYWQDDERYAQLAPNLERPSMQISSIKSQLQRVLKGAGLKDVDINVTKSTSSQPQMQIDFDFLKDVKKDFKDLVNDTTCFTLM